MFLINHVFLRADLISNVWFEVITNCNVMKQAPALCTREVWSTKARVM